MKLNNTFVFIKNKLLLFYRTLSYKFLPYYTDITSLIIFLRVKIKKYDRNVLGIIDYNKSNYALGDTIIFVVNLLIQKHYSGSKEIHICIVFNSKKNKPEKHEWLIQVLNLIPNNIKSIFYFKDKTEFNEFRKIKFHLYRNFPSNGSQLHCDTRVLHKYYKKYNKLPELTVDQNSLLWANKLINKISNSKKLIIIGIRNSFKIKNPNEFYKINREKGAGTRNSNLPEWENFLYQIDRKKYFIICLCDYTEIIPSWREKNLVTYSTDLGANVIKDFALIQLSYISLFPSSGMFQYAFFRDTPSILFNRTKNYAKLKSDPIHRLNNPLKDGQQFIYQNYYQRIYWGPDTCENIMMNFLDLEKDIDNKKTNYYTK